jgi:hypothetical protein
VTNVSSSLNRVVADALVADRLREAKRFQRSQGAARDAADAYDSVTVRLARPVDTEALVRLSELDGGKVPRGSVLVAEVGGAVLAARSLENGASVADPFQPTVQLTELLELRSAHLRDAARGRGIRRRLRPLAWVLALRRRPRRARLQETQNR